MIILQLEFPGTTVPRKEFLKAIRKELIETLTMRAQILITLITEISKNIYDHAEGYGTLEIKEIELGVFSFDIQDKGNEAHDLGYCRNHSRLAGNGTNFNAGIRIIQDIAEMPNFEHFKTDTTKGFHYSGLFRQNPLQ